MRLNIASMQASELIEHLKSYIDIAGGDCEVRVFDNVTSRTYDVINTCTDGDHVFYIFHRINTPQRNQCINNECW